MNLSDMELKAKLPHNFGVTPFYKLRWRFEYVGRRDRIGVWNGSANMANKHNYQPKDGLLWAVIEGEKIGAWTVEPFVRVSGQDYFTMKWLAATAMPGILRKDFEGSFTLPHNKLGLAIYSRKNVYTVTVDGKVHKREIKPHEKAIKLAEHSFGGQ